MIGYLKGVIQLKSPPIVIIEASGIGYEVEAPMSTFYELAEIGDEVTLHTHFVVREDAQLLYGFAKLRDRDLFRTVLKVKGVGPRMGLAILSAMNTDEFLACVSSDDAASLTRIPGVGKKTADQIVLDLRDKVDGFGAVAAPVKAGKAAKGAKADASRDAISALEALGYRPAEATRIVRSIKAENLGTEELIREALRMLAS